MFQHRPKMQNKRKVGTLKSEISELKTEFNNTIQKVEDLSAKPEKGTTNENKIELANIQEKFQKIETKQLSTDNYVETLKQFLPPDDSLVLLSAFKKNFYALQHLMDSKLNEQREALLNGNSTIMTHINSLHPDRPWTPGPPVYMGPPQTKSQTPPLC